jgi:hypothetical protein|tara:strand:+ start:415 stop:1053 length:639 start_codon:yes stop_codon:yes gene_type:complete
MRKLNLINISIFLLINIFFSSSLYSQINNTIAVKVGESLITSIDIENEIITNLIISGREINQANIDKNKNFSIKNLINKSIKRAEIKKYEIKDYNKQDLQNYSNDIAKKLNTNSKGLKEIFKQFNANYEVFLEKHETELLWNTLIFQLYKNQININIVDVENEFEKSKENKNEKELKEIRTNILNKKKEDKLNLFSRSHFLNLENTAFVKFQ